MIDYYTIDAQHIYTGAVQIDPYAPLPHGTITPPPDTTGDEVAQWTGVDWVVLPERPPLPEPPQPVVDSRITRLAFRNRFTPTEKAIIELAALDDPSAAQSVRMRAAALRANQADIAAATFIDLGRPDTRAGVQMLEAAGLLAVGRALEILDAPIQPEERPL